MLKVENVYKTFGGVTALNGVSIEVKHGTVVGLIGPNGSGKSTLFQVISGFHTKDKGHITLKGQSIDGLPAHRIAALGLSRTFQIPQVARRMTVMENLIIGPMGQIGENPMNVFFKRKSYHHQEAALKEKAEELLSLVGLSRLRDDYAGSVPGGQLKLLSLAQALMNDGDIILLDEPTAGVDLALTDSIIEYLHQMHAQGKTLLIVEHRMRVISNICQYVFVLDAGEIIAKGEPTEVQNNAKVIEAYLGSRYSTQAPQD